MKINIVCVGKLKENYLRDAIAEYSKRLSKFTNLSVIEVEDSKLPAKTDGDINKIKLDEASRILPKLKGYLICLDLRGEMLSSEQFAETFSRNMTAGVSEFSLLIGGSHGIATDILARADSKISFGKMTYPHQLMRVILIEQIYRAFMINNNQEYHK